MCDSYLLLSKYLGCVYKKLITKHVKNMRNDIARSKTDLTSFITGAYRTMF